MPHQSLPDNFYYMIFFFAPLLLVVGRSWEVVIILLLDSKAGARLSKREKQFAIGVGLGCSLLAVTMLFSQYNVHETKIGLNEMYAVNHVLGVCMWGTVIAHIVSVPSMLFFWFWYHPAPHKRI